MSVTVKVRNKDRLLRKLKAMAPAMERELGAAVRKSAEDVAAQAKQWAPRSTGSGSTPDGHYAETINAKRVDQIDARRANFKIAKGVNAVVNPELAWGVYAYWTWRFIEFGTKLGAPAHPHLMPAARMFQRRIKSGISRAINKSIKQVAQKS